MGFKTIKVLVMENNPSFAAFLDRELKAGFYKVTEYEYRFVVDIVESFDEVVYAFEKSHYDILISAFNPPKEEHSSTKEFWVSLQIIGNLHNPNGTIGNLYNPNGTIGNLYNPNGTIKLKKTKADLITDQNPIPIIISFEKTNLKIERLIYFMVAVYNYSTTWEFSKLNIN